VSRYETESYTRSRYVVWFGGLWVKMNSAMLLWWKEDV